MKPLPYIDDLIREAPSPLARKLFQTFAASAKDSSLQGSDHITLLKEVLEQSLIETNTDATSGTNNP